MLARFDGTLPRPVAKKARFTPRVIAILLWVGLFAVYNANGREIGGSDSQPTKMAARALALRGNLLLDEDVRRIPQLAERGSFARDLQGHYRSAYSPVGSLLGGVTAVLLRGLGADLDAPRGANLIAKLTASTLTALAVCFAFLTLTRFASMGVALAVAVGLGLGTNYWALHSQTMVQHEVVAFGLGLAMLCWARPVREIAMPHLWLGALGLGLAVTARTPPTAHRRVTATTRRMARRRRRRRWRTIPHRARPQATRTCRSIRSVWQR